MIKFLIPDEVCEYCTLIEAIEWIAFKSYPVARWDDNWERFFEPSSIESFLSDEDIESELDKEFTLLYSKSKDGGVINETKLKELLNKRDQEDSLKEEKYQRDIEDAKHELFIALRKGEITAYGIFFDKVKEGYASSQWNDKKAWDSVGDDEDDEDDSSDDAVDNSGKIHGLYSEDMFLNEKKVQKIPASYWRFEGVSWQFGKMRCPEGRYVYIHFDFNNIIEVFKEAEPEYVTVEKRNGHLFYITEDDKSDQRIIKKKLGRKTVVNWDLVHPYITSQIVESGGILSKQDSFAQDVQDWIVKELNKKVGISTIKEKLKPYYKTFQK